MNNHHTPTPVITDDLLTTPEVAQVLRVDVTTVRRWIKERVLDAVALPHTGKRTIYRIPRYAIEQLLATTPKEAHT